MRNYELTVVLPSSITDEEVPAVVETVSGWVTSQGGTIAEVNNWGRRKLAYLIGTSNEGTYVLLRVAIDPAGVPEIERNLKLSQQVIRYLMIRTEV